MPLIDQQLQQPTPAESVPILNGARACRAPITRDSVYWSQGTRGANDDARGPAGRAIAYPVSNGERRVALNCRRHVNN